MVKKFYILRQIEILAFRDEFEFVGYKIYKKYDDEEYAILLKRGLNLDKMRENLKIRISYIYYNNQFRNEIFNLIKDNFKIDFEGIIKSDLVNSQYEIDLLIGFESTINQLVMQSDKIIESIFEIKSLPYHKPFELIELDEESYFFEVILSVNHYEEYFFEFHVAPLNSSFSFLNLHDAINYAASITAISKICNNISLFQGELEEIVEDIEEFNKFCEFNQKCYFDEFLKKIVFQDFSTKDMCDFFILLQRDRKPFYIKKIRVKEIPLTYKETFPREEYNSLPF